MPGSELRTGQAAGASGASPMSDMREKGELSRGEVRHPEALSVSEARIGGYGGDSEAGANPDMFSAAGARAGQRQAPGGWGV